MTKELMKNLNVLLSGNGLDLENKCFRFDPT